MEELHAAVHMENYDVIALIEVQAKNSNLICCEFVLQGYSCMTVMEEHGVCVAGLQLYDSYGIAWRLSLYQGGIQHCKTHGNRKHLTTQHHFLIHLDSIAKLGLQFGTCCTCHLL